jgi:retinoid hydroxylase
MAAKRINGGLGAPVLGNTLAFLGDPVKFTQQRYQRYGLIFQMGFLGKRTIVLLGAEAQKYVLAENPRNFLSEEGARNAAPFLAGSLALLDGPAHDSQRKLISPAFHSRNMPAYVARINQVIDRQMDSWGAQGTRTFYPEARQIAFTLASSLLLGIEPGAEYERLITLWEQYSKGFVSLVRIDAPFTIYGRSMRAQRTMTPWLRSIIAKRRGVESSDALGLLVNAKDEDGNTISDDDLIQEIKLMLFAGYDTTAGTIGWMLAELLRRPDLLERVRVEVRADEKDAPITFEDLKQKPLLDAMIKETLRLHPQSAFNMRGVKAPFEFGGYTISPGVNIMLAPVFTHRMAEYFADPEQFDPDRFLAPRDEDTKHPYAWIGFGGGPRICIGMGIAQIEIKAMFTRLMRRFDVQLVPDQDLSPMYVPLSRPKGDVVITYAAR